MGRESGPDATLRTDTELITKKALERNARIGLFRRPGVYEYDRRT